MTTLTSPPDLADDLDPDAPTEPVDAGGEAVDLTDIGDLELMWLDPAELIPDPANLRMELRDMDSMTDSIRAVGVLQALLVTTLPDGRHQVVFGHRRREGAIRAGRPLVPCLVHSGSIDDLHRLTAQMVENLRRSDLSAVEEAAGYEQLTAFGLDETEIASRVGSSLESVVAGRTLARAPKTLSFAADHSLTLEVAAGVAEFEDDEGAYQELTRVLVNDPDRFRHALSRARQERRDAAAREEILRNLGDVPVITGHPSYGFTRGYATRLASLRNAEGKKITPAKHRKCPGHAAYIEERGPEGPKVVWVCTDPSANGHRDERGGGKVLAAALPPEERAAASDERKTVIGNNKAWRAAEPVRRAWLEELYGRVKPPKGALRFATTAILGDSWLLHSHGGTLHGPELTKALDVPDTLLPMLLLRQACRALEASLTVDAWRRPPTGTASYLTYLGSIGYPLSEVEQVAIDASLGKKRRRPTIVGNVLPGDPGPDVVLEDELDEDAGAPDEDLPDEDLPEGAAGE